MALGYAVNLLEHLKQVSGGAYPGTKVTAPGYLKMLLADKSPGVQLVNSGWDGNDAHFREMKVKYSNRGVEANTSDEDSCDIDVIPVYNEADVSLRFFRQIGIGIDDATIQRYMSEASKTVKVGTPATEMMNEHLGAIIEQLQGLFQAIDGDLLGVQAVNFGKNVRTGSAAASNININKQGTINDLNDGFGRILADMVENEFSGTPKIVGSGLFNNFDVQKMMLSANQAGINIGQFPYNFLWDPKTATKWGTNQIGVFEPGAVKLLHRNRYLGAFAGEKGGSFFFTMSPPIVDQFGDSLGAFKLDAQLKYYDCPTELTVNSYGGTRSFGRGWVLIVSAFFDQFNLPTDAYDSGDRLTGNNGTLRYTITNECVDCD